MRKIADFFLRKLLPNPKYNFANPIDDKALLFADFMTAWTKCIADYKKTYPQQDLAFSETYRSNILQKKYYNQGASKVQKNGMHHYGIAGDTIFIINGKKTYKGDINLIRKIYKNNGLTVLGMWDPLHVQFITVSDQPLLRNAVKEKIIAFQKQYNLLPTGEDDAQTIAKAKQVFG
jgi:hypothetical protein